MPRQSPVNCLCCRYWRGKGFYTNLLSEVMNLMALLFFFLFSAFLLFFVRWSASSESCEESCELLELYLQNPLRSTSPSFWTALRLLFLVLFGVYWLGTLVAMLSEVRSDWRVMQFCRLKLGISEEQIKWVTWGEMVHRLVLIQKTTHLCRYRELTEPDIIHRILRKDNYLVGMINKGVLNLHVPIIGFKKRHLLTKMMEWSLRWGLLNPMFDQDFEIRQQYCRNPAFLEARFRRLALVHLMLAPFMLVFLVIYFLMMNVERFYHSPASLTERSWSPYAQWRLREFNEMPHQLDDRLGQSQKPAQEYLSQFPSYAMKHVGRFVSFILESFVALLLCVALMDDTLLEHGVIMGHNLVWWAAVLMIALRVARGLVPDHPVLDPDICLEAVVRHTHFYPKLWRGQGRTREVQESFQRMFRYRALNFCDEVLSVFLAPYILYFSLPQSSDLIAQFLQNYTVRIDGVGDVCSLATFDFGRHGNRNYGSSEDGAKSERSRQGKMEKSFLSFVASYPTWRPHPCGQHLLENLHSYLIASVCVRGGLTQSNGELQSSFQRRSGASIEMSISQPQLPDEQPLDGVLGDRQQSEVALQGYYEARNVEMGHLRRSDSAS